MASSTGGDRSRHGDEQSRTAAPIASSRMFAFRADADLVSALSAVPNVSAFIRKAIARSLAEPCPLCEGHGVVAPGFRAELERLGGHVVLRRCDCCAAEFPAACDAAPSRLRGIDRLRQQLASARGEFVCAACLGRAGDCDTCGRPYQEHAPAAFARHWRARRCGHALVTAPRARRTRSRRPS